MWKSSQSQTFCNYVYWWHRNASMVEIFVLFTKKLNCFSICQHSIGFLEHKMSFYFKQCSRSESISYSKLWLWLLRLVVVLKYMTIDFCRTIKKWFVSLLFAISFLIIIIMLTTHNIKIKNRPMTRLRVVNVLQDFFSNSLNNSKVVTIQQLNF